MGQYQVALSGEPFRNEDGSDRQSEIRICKVGEAVRLERDHGNAHDSECVRVWSARGVQIGNVRHGAGFSVSKAIDTEEEVSATIDSIGLGEGDWLSVVLTIATQSSGFFKKPTRDLSLANAAVGSAGRNEETGEPDLNETSPLSDPPAISIPVESSKQFIRENGCFFTFIGVFCLLFLTIATIPTDTPEQLKAKAAAAKVEAAKDADAAKLPAATAKADLDAASSSEKSVNAPSDENVQVGWQMRSRETMDHSLKDGDSAKYEGVRAYRFSAGGAVGYAFCGNVNAKNSFGGYGGFERFIATPGIVKLESQTTSFAKDWAEYCAPGSEGSHISW